MEEWDRFPLFAPCGALPFPRDAPARRASTFRRTAERFRTNPHSALIYFPEGTLHTPEEGVLPFDARSFQRLDRILPDKLWVPAALHYTWWGESLPTVLLYPGTPHLEATGDERDRLRALLAELRSAPPRHTELLFEGRRGPNEQRDLARTRAFFRRYL
jgi:1-acyl-sn-glycerol-3-phosphate acyltransferase